MSGMNLKMQGMNLKITNSWTIINWKGHGRKPAWPDLMKA
jgi:hypothetical protein